ncbi:Aminoglycoside phosphotransferase [Listeria monocytogenes FSL J1-208]|uniref:aminoglycoside phosphotransferase family protein n=1 Tax=Listeria monocytogenes TaxID=1639 RepID=UPI000254856C|nr:phosphotransferase family protein [Listeria monocytogenes]EAE5921773.1 phosphotransferase family protein [Listeria monocytogenes]EAG6687384.1 phosphotransferase family protein [Listeria monocytogenes]EHY62417.1 Aminoglycoside phosphotransferase [Listeria monocytogenes FSL J1-208]OEO49318.1 aminoglycoside phosphotransferase [Listeria monocytogenes]QOF61717.1 phosphotransferase family protein [Listeria monocytogenes FSL J1-208]
MDVARLKMLHNAKVISEIKKGFSINKKYQVDETYLVRVFPIDLLQERKQEFKIIQALNSQTPFVPKAYDFGFIEREGYMIISYLQGEDAESGMTHLSHSEQFKAGFSAGEILREVHKIPLDIPKMNWLDFQTAKFKRKVEELKELEITASFLTETEQFVYENLTRLKNRPVCLQHGDFHPANIILKNNKFVGLIDFNRLEFGDPLFDLAKIGFFTTEVSIPFARGSILGYIDKEEVTDFWNLYALYTAMHITSAVNWAAKNESRNFKKLMDYAAKTAASHDNFQKIVPSWMNEEEFK